MLYIRLFLVLKEWRPLVPVVCIQVLDVFYNNYKKPLYTQTSWFLPPLVNYYLTAGEKLIAPVVYYLETKIKMITNHFKSWTRSSFSLKSSLNIIHLLCRILSLRPQAIIFLREFVSRPCWRYLMGLQIPIEFGEYPHSWSRWVTRKQNLRNQLNSTWVPFARRNVRTQAA